MKAMNEKCVGAPSTAIERTKYDRIVVTLTPPPLPPPHAMDGSAVRSPSCLLIVSTVALNNFGWGRHRLLSIALKELDKVRALKRSIIHT